MVGCSHTREVEFDSHTPLQTQLPDAEKLVRFGIRKTSFWLSICWLIVLLRRTLPQVRLVGNRETEVHCELSQLVESQGLREDVDRLQICVRFILYYTYVI